MVRKLVFTLVVLLFSASGSYLGRYLAELDLLPLTDTMKFGVIGLGALIGLVLGILLTPWLIRFSIWLTALLEQMLSKTPVQDLVMGSVGLIIGLIIANLLGSVFSFMGFPGEIIWIAITLLLGYLGMTISVKKREEIMSFFSNIPRLGGSKEKAAMEAKHAEMQKILDTSVIIDGRIADLSASGFIEGTLVVPGFVLEELRHIADSSDLLKRNRGRRGLDILNELRKDSTVKVVIYDNNKGIDDALEVDTKLVKLAQKLGAKIMTNDFNLNKVAELHGVKVLNINELANAVKPIVLPGEEMVVQVVKEGKESGQGVAYLDDGTMIVVDGGKLYMHQTITVLVTSVLQTAAGRMIFAKFKTDRRGDTKQQVHNYEEVKMLG
ncbi:putative PIN and TRAM-domain containing protein precursor [Sporotomaculum syntrophicum]|uniref:PIN and TRAM-domain containing protein n=1 Tax=Sporotomaculum syntrophicum TaxID=182264 RepID=A0A9D2WLR8_9FIRM|nr:PIN/TRAM domain-containing protein [Sporotomaculum syntrophicum]KAF1083777.1 putative PIN and TRAM-domain containing protein precursor [Sporotomaculum syntrophicum]